MQAPPIGIPGMPSLGADKIASGAWKAVQHGETLLKKHPALGKIVGWLGSSPVYREGDYAGPNKKEGAVRPKGILGFVRRYVTSYGYILTALSAAANFILNRQPAEGEKSGFLMGLVKLGAQILMIGSPILTLYSQMKGFPIFSQAGEAGKEEAQLESLGGSKLDVRDKDFLAKAATNPIQRFNTGKGPDGKVIIVNGRSLKDEHSNLISISNGREIRVGLIGPQGTGKSTGSDIVVGRILKQEGADNCVVLMMDCKKIKHVIEENLEAQGAYENLSELGGGMTQNIMALKKMKSTEMLNLYMKDIIQKAREANAKGKRFIVQVDDIHVLRDFAERQNQQGQKYIDYDAFHEIMSTFNLVWEQSKKRTGIEMDIIYTSNVSVAQIFGIDPNDLKQLDWLKGTVLGPIYNRLVGDQETIGMPQTYTQTKIIAAYLLEMQQYLKESDTQFFGDDLIPVVQGKSGADKEKALADYIFNEFYEKMRQDEDQSTRYTQYTIFLEGRNMEKAIKSIKERYLFDNNTRNSSKVTLAIIEERLEDMLSNLTNTNRTESKANPHNGVGPLHVEGEGN